MFAMQAANMRRVQIAQLPKRSHGGQTRNAGILPVDGPEQDEKTALFFIFYLTFV
jgi:hypothetical protein